MSPASRPTSYPNSFFQRAMWLHRSSISPANARIPTRVDSRASKVPTSRQPTIPLTASLLESEPFALITATESPFILAAGQGKLAKPLLSKWLSQARLITQARLSLLGALIARVDLPYVHLSDEAKAASVRWRIINVLSHALQLSHQDLAFYSSVAQRYELDLEF